MSSAIDFSAIKEKKKTCPVILHVGVDTERKNISSLYKALSLLEVPYFCVRIGASLDKHVSKQHLHYIHQHHLNVLQLDHVSEEELFAWYKTADVFVFPSLFEGFGRPPVEAQMAGCPVISSHA